jgi:hypothetical protein
MSTATATVVITTANCEVVLDAYGFFVRCTSPNCSYVSEYTSAKHVARRLAEAHDHDETANAARIAAALAAFAWS